MSNLFLIELVGVLSNRSFLEVNARSIRSVQIVYSLAPVAEAAPPSRNRLDLTLCTTRRRLSG